jgi:hypothetical protein
MTAAALDQTPPDRDRSSDSRAIHVKNLRKSYGAINAVQGISLHVVRGEIVGLIGCFYVSRTCRVHSIAGFTQNLLRLGLRRRSQFVCCSYCVVRVLRGIFSERWRVRPFPAA